MTRPAALAFDGLCVAVVTLLMLWPALYNGYVLLYPDSAVYVALSFAPQEYVPRGLAYPLLMYGLDWGYSLWLLIAVQAVMVAWVLHETMAVFARRRQAAWLLALGMALAVLTGLPWTIDQVMPDFFAGLVVLCILLSVLFGDRLSSVRCSVLLLIAAIGVACHTSHAPFAVGLLIFCAAVLKWQRLPLRRLTPALAATAAGIALTVLINLIVTDQAYFSRGGEQFLFSRMVGDGIVADYLREVCPRPDLSLCALKDPLPDDHNDYLWNKQEAFLALGAWQPTPELRDIIVDSLKRMPLRHAIAAVVDTVGQLLTLDLGDSLTQHGPRSTRIMEVAFPRDALDYHDARQQTGRLRPTITLLNQVQRPIQFAAMAILFALAGWMAWRGRKPTAGFCLLVLAALVLNAFICGVFSGFNNRYQSRVAWLALTGVMLVGIGYSRTGRLSDLQR